MSCVYVHPERIVNMRKHKNSKHASHGISGSSELARDSACLALRSCRSFESATSRGQALPAIWGMAAPPPSLVGASFAGDMVPDYAVMRKVVLMAEARDLGVQTRRKVVKKRWDEASHMEAPRGGRG